MNMIASWVKELFVVILSITFLEIMLPEGTLRKYVTFIFSIVMMALILSPIVEMLHKQL